MGEGVRCSRCAPQPPKLRPAGFWRGFGTFFRAVGFLVRTPRTKRHAIAPVVIAYIIFIVSAFVLWDMSEPLRTAIHDVSWFPEWARAVVRFIVNAVMLGVFLVLLWFTSAPLTTIVAAPFLDLLVGRVDEVRTGAPRSVEGGFFSDTAFTILQSVAMVALILTLNIIAFAIAFIPPVGPILSFGLVSLGAGLGALDIATARRRFTFSQKLATAKLNAAFVAGFGTSLVLASLVPFVGFFLAIPVAAVGGTLLVYERKTKGGAPPVVGRKG